MKTIYKYVLNAQQPDIIELPVGAQILSARSQTGEDICIWALVEFDHFLQVEQRRIWTFGTGHEIPTDLNLKHIDTVLLYKGGLVFHVFEEA